MIARPIVFSCSAVIPKRAEDICEDIANVNRWPGFSGFGPLPGIASAEYLIRTDEMSGSRISVRNTDGSRHVEDILDWEPGKRIRIKLHEFTPPLSRLATHFIETWQFEEAGGNSQTVRSFEIHPKSPSKRPLLWLISILFRQAIARHLADISMVDHRPTN